MMLRPLTRALAIVTLSSVATAAAAADGIVIVQRTTTTGAPTTTELQMDASRLRTDLTVAGGRQTVIFDGARQTLWVIDTTRKSYFEMSKADVERLSAQVQGAMAMLANLPPAQRAQMESMLGRGGMTAMAGLLGGGAPARKPEFRPAGTDTVGRFTCRLYETVLDGQKTGEVCAAEPQALDMTTADFDVLQQMGAFIAALLPQAAEQIVTLGRADAQGYDGLPLRTVTSAGAVPVTTEVVDITRRALPDSTFAVPEGFTKQASPLANLGGLGGRGGRP